MSADASSSTSAFVSSLIFHGIIASCFVTGFVILRRKFTRTYEPRSINDILTITQEERIEPCPKGFFEWLPYILTKSQAFILQHAGPDGYFFLRFLGVFATFSLVAGLILMPILLPVNATDGHDLKGFELLSFSNVTNKHRFYAHVFLSWLIFGLLLFVIYKELYYYVSFRQALQTTPLYDNLLSSRTVILTELSPDFVNDSEFQRLFPQATNINFATDVKELIDLTNERRDNATKLENALNSCIKKSVKLERKGKVKDIENKRKDDLETYIPFRKRPTHHLGKPFLPPMEFLFHRKKVNTIEYSTERISKLNDTIHPLQETWTKNDHLPTVFLQFSDQLEAQKAFQSISTLIDKKRFGKKFIGVSPIDINWENVNLTTKERWIRTIIANTFLTLMIVFWSIPVAVVGTISNINFLTEKVPFLRFINHLPNVLMGLITGILPTVALAVLMSLVVPIITKMGKIAGKVTYQETSVFVQKWYFAFEVVHVFIVVTLASSASATVQAIIEHPDEVWTLLAENIPKSSNFYIAYFMLLGLSEPSGALLQIVNLLLQHVLTFLDGTPRAKWKRFNTLSQPNYSVLYPSIQLLAVIQICYMVISPIIMVFATFTFTTVYIANLYNHLYVMLPPRNDSRGRNYPAALFQMFTAVYLSEVCLLGLFIMSKSWGPMALEIILMVVTVLANLYLERRFLPLIDNVPLSCILLARGNTDVIYNHRDQGLEEIKDQARESKRSHDNDETGGAIRDATPQELQRANLLFSTPSLSSESIISSESSTIKSTASGSPVNGGDKIQEKGGESKYNKNRSSTFSGDVSVESDKTKFTPGANPDTFVNENEEFKKIHYSDVDPSYWQNKHLYSDDEDEGPVRRNEADVVVHLSGEGLQDDPASSKKDMMAYPGIIFKGKTWSSIARDLFKPWRRYTFEFMRLRLPYAYNAELEYNESYTQDAYINPCVSEKDPIIWIGKDPMGISQQQIGVARVIGVDVDDINTEFDSKGRLRFTGPPPGFVPASKK